jgi:two-component system, chemotaxis family, protein-glutamate methylesterase/glutaminase
MNKMIISPYSLIVIGISTGGPNTLSQIIQNLHKIKVPIVIVQHIAENFPQFLVNSLQKLTSIPISVAKEGEEPSSNHIYLSDGGKHLVLTEHQVNSKKVYQFSYQKTEPVKSCRPSIDVFFQSVASCYKEKVLMIIGTGLGDDGLDGVKALKQANQKNICICQTKASSVFME